jgi:hypothetical protein
MAKDACGDYLVPDPIQHLNSLAAGLLDDAVAAATTSADEIQNARARSDALQGDDYPLEYYADGHPKLPTCLDRRRISLAEAA